MDEILLWVIKIAGTFALLAGIFVHLDYLQSTIRRRWSRRFQWTTYCLAQMGWFRGARYRLGVWILKPALEKRMRELNQVSREIEAACDELECFAKLTPADERKLDIERGRKDHVDYMSIMLSHIHSGQTMSWPGQEVD